jgi:dihydrofolate reductase|tara:strand:- start:71 stop:607 length:537 start_codon:yes stop_codon:yes gene_type:complete
MSGHRRLTLHIATSSDGFIATTDDGLEWLPQPSGAEDYGMGAFMETVDCVIIGRKTWDVIRHFEEEQFPNFERHILSYSTHDGTAFISELKQKRGKGIWLLGGGILNEECLKANIIDEIVITKFPVELGEGIPVFGALGDCLPPQWEKVSQHLFSDGEIQSVWIPTVENRLHDSVGGF